MRPAATSENYLIFAATSWVASGFAGAALDKAGVYGATSIAEFAAFIALTAMFPGEPGRRWSTGLIVGSVGVAMAFVAPWILAYAMPYVDDFKFPAGDEIDRIDLIAGYLASGLIAPLFEEKICRHLALRGVIGVLPSSVARLAPPTLIASLLISAIFALAHPGLMILTFVFSLALCGLALRLNLNTLQRATIHGAYHCFVITFYVTHGFGLWA